MLHCLVGGGRNNKILAVVSFSGARHRDAAASRRCRGGRCSGRRMVQLCSRKHIPIGSGCERRGSWPVRARRPSGAAGSLILFLLGPQHFPYHHRPKQSLSSWRPDPTPRGFPRIILRMDCSSALVNTGRSVEARHVAAPPFANC